MQSGKQTQRPLNTPRSPAASARHAAALNSLRASPLTPAQGLDLKIENHLLHPSSKTGLPWAVFKQRIPMIPTHESLASAGNEDDGDDLEAILNQRESEMDHDPSQEISHQEFLAHFSARRKPRCLNTP
jgi:hypothetical protein